jgi:hypothetical protein
VYSARKVTQRSTHAGRVDSDESLTADAPCRELQVSQEKVIYCNALKHVMENRGGCTIAPNSFAGLFSTLIFIGIYLRE